MFVNDIFIFYLFFYHSLKFFQKLINEIFINKNVEFNFVKNPIDDETLYATKGKIKNIEIKFNVHKEYGMRIQ